MAPIIREVGDQGVAFVAVVSREGIVITAAAGVLVIVAVSAFPVYQLNTLISDVYAATYPLFLVRQRSTGN